MGFWLNNFQEFERKKNRRNRLILNFYYVPDNGEARSVKLFARTDIKIPTDFIFDEKKVEETKEKIENDGELRNFLLEEYIIGNRNKFHVLEIEMPHEKRLIDKLPKKFQIRDYDKLLKLNGFYPERKVALPDVLEDIIKDSEIIEIKDKKGRKIGEEREIDLSLLYGIFEKEFMTEEELRNLPWIYWDIEKPLWKREDEKKLLKARKKLLKLNKKIGNQDNKQELRLRAIKSLEGRLTIEVEGIGKVGLYEEKYDAAVSFIASIWKNCNREKEIKEVYILDPKNEFEFEEANGYKIVKFKTEKELIKGFIDRTHERKPVVSSGHNEVYDVTQVRFAGEQYKIDFDPVVEQVKPRRDFVKKFFQRMREDLIYIDSLSLNSILYPWSRQRSLGTSLKLGDVVKFHGINFKKSLGHEQLREVELQRLYGKTSEIRKEAGRKLLQYVTDDVEPVRYMIENSPFLSLITKLKKILPYCTYSEIAFHTNCVQKYFDKKHFDESRNKRFSERSQKERQNEIQIFKKRFPSLKKKMCGYARIETRKVRGEHENIYEIYLPFEEWIKKSMVCWAPEWLEMFDKIDEKEKIGFLQYVKALQRDNILLDYSFARRDARIFKKYNTEECSERFKRLEEKVDKEKLDSFLGSFKNLKDHFRSIYVALNGEGRRLIQPGKKIIGQLNLFQEAIPKVMKYEEDLYLLRENCGKIDKILKKIDVERKNRGLEPLQKRRELTRFMTIFNTFEELSREISNEAGESPEVVLLYNQFKKKWKREASFYQECKMPVSRFKEFIRVAYKNLAKELEKYNVKVVDSKGDYLFVKADPSIKQSKLVYVVREFLVYEVKQN